MLGSQSRPFRPSTIANLQEHLIPLPRTLDSRMPLTQFRTQESSVHRALRAIICEDLGEAKVADMHFLSDTDHYDDPIMRITITIAHGHNRPPARTINSLTTRLKHALFDYGDNRYPVLSIDTA